MGKGGAYYMDLKVMPIANKYAFFKIVFRRAYATWDMTLGLALLTHSI